LCTNWRNRAARQKAPSGKREPIIDHALEDKITKQDEDRRLRIVDDELEANNRTLNDLRETPMLTYAEWQHRMRPFCERFAALPVDEKRRLITSRFQGVKLKDYRVVSLYLLTRDMVSPVPTRQVEVDPTKCPSCLRAKKSPRETCCDDCTDGMAAERAEQKARRSGRDQGVRAGYAPAS
jgi:hypothetical protein